MVKFDGNHVKLIFVPFYMKMKFNWDQGEDSGFDCFKMPMDEMVRST